MIRGTLNRRGRLGRRYLVSTEPKPPATGWRRWAKRGLKLVFYWVPLSLGLAGILVLPFLNHEPFYIAQMLLAVVFIVSMRFEAGLGRYGDALDKHTGWRRRLDHLTLLLMLALIGVMGQTAKTAFFGWTWTVFGALFTVMYLLKVTGWKPRQERFARERAEREEAGRA